MKRLWVVAVVLLSALAVGQAVALTKQAPPRVVVPLLQPGDPPGGLQAPGAADAVLEARVMALGDYLTIEDLARGVLALERGELEGVEALGPDERSQVSALLAQADRHRTELLQVEEELRTAESELAVVARDLAASLSPEQRERVLRERNAVSVGSIERAYWDAVLAELAAEGTP